jgi:hypothetical protein
MQRHEAEHELSPVLVLDKLKEGMSQIDGD